jgi:primosomal protein N' (replication factor Y)
MAKCFPHARIVRIDSDVTTRRDSYARILGDFRSGKTDILVGTQMIAKGLHFPNVTLVGVVYADHSLHMPDFRAGERTFQLLAQVAGRAGRGDVAGEVIVQTYTPFHVAVQAARRQDYVGFCDQEVEFRRELSYPPFSHLVCVTLKGASEERVKYCAATLAGRLGAAAPKTVILADPSPAPLARAKGLYRYQVMMRCASTRSMTAPLKAVLKDFSPPADVRISVDVDALSLM